jgi:GNAT superfamily N-acetyltransferase
MVEAVRWAGLSDDAPLRELCRRTPMRGPVSYTLEREPEFFALTRLQGDEGGRVAVIAEGEQIVAMAMMAPMRVWLGGKVLRSAYIGDLKVDPDYRNEGLGGRMLNFLGDELRRERIDLSSFLVLAGNPMLQLMRGGEGRFGAQKVSSIRNYFLLFGSSRSQSSDLTITEAKTSSIPEMIEVWNRVNGTRSFAPVLDEKLLTRRTTSAIPLRNFRLAWRDGRIVAFCATWDAGDIKQIRVLRLNPALVISTGLYNAAARVLGRPRFPRTGDRLPSLYLSHACAERAADLETLLDHVHDEYRRSGCLYMDLAFDRTDPLVAALRRFRSLKIDFELWAAITPGARPELPLDDFAYFDIAFV